MQLKGKFIQELQRDPDTGIGYYDFFIRPEKKRVTARRTFPEPGCAGKLSAGWRLCL